MKANSSLRYQSGHNQQRKVMKKRGFKSWVRNRIETQRKMTIAAAASMAGLGAFLFLIAGGFMFLLFSMAYGGFPAFLFVALIFGFGGVLSWFAAEKELSDQQHKVECDGRKMRIHVAPATSWVWTWAFGSLDSDQSVIQKIIGLTNLIPRLFCAAWHTYQRLEDVRQIDESTTLSLMKLLFQKNARVGVCEIIDELDGIDIKKAMRDISLLDGIVFLTKGNLGVSIAPRLSDDFEAWRTRGQPTTDSDSPFV